MPNLALFDFDGTLTLKDTLLEFIKFYKGKKSFYLGLLVLSPVLLLFKFRLLKNWKAKETVLSYFFAGQPIDTFNGKCQEFARDIVPALLRNEALEKLKEHLKNGDKTLIVSASPENWIKPWSDIYGVALLGTQLEVRDGLLTGKLKGKNCYGSEKVVRIKSFIGEEKYEETYAYGDSRGDKKMLMYATKPFYRFIYKEYLK